MVARWAPFVVWPMRFDLGEVSYGSHLPENITVTVREPVIGYAMQATGKYASIISISSSCAADMAAGPRRTIVVDFCMQQAGSASDTMYVSATGSQK
jgi:hypothetical protein